MNETDRRSFQRLKLAKPILATLAGHSALILDIGMSGAFVEHYGTVAPGNRFELSFKWQGEDVTYKCEVNRTSVIKQPGGPGESGVSQSGVTFTEAVGDSDERLQEMMATFVGRILAAQRANAEAEEQESAAVLYQLGQARRTRSRGYMAYLWDGESWVCRHTQLGEQPRNGFTVAGHEDQEELEMLCRAYEKGDDEARRLIRLVAELSVRSAKG